MDFNNFPKLISLCKWIAVFEGDKSSRHNFGSERCQQDSATWPNGCIGVDNGFCVFKDDQIGWNFLHQKYYNICTGQSKTYNEIGKRLFNVLDSSQLTLLQTITIQSPTSDGNNPLHYAEFLANKLGCSVDDKMSYFIASDVPEPIKDSPINVPDLPKVAWYTVWINAIQDFVDNIIKMNQ